LNQLGGLSGLNAFAESSSRLSGSKCLNRNRFRIARSWNKKMDLKLREEEKLIRDTAARFVSRELITREGDYLRQKELFLPPGDPDRRELDPVIRGALEKQARQIGLWALELPESAGGSAQTAVARVLIFREFGRTILPFEPACAPALLGESAYGQSLARGKQRLSLAFDQVHETGTLNNIQTRFREEAGGFLLSDSSIDVLDPAADLFLLPAREPGSERVGVFLLERNTPGVLIGEESDFTTDTTGATLTLSKCKVPKERVLGYEYEAGAIIAAEQLRIAARSLGIGMRCLADSIEHARNRVTFGWPLAARQAIQWMLADLSIDLRTCTWLTLEAAWRDDQGLPHFDAAALAKKRAAKMAFDAADTAIQIHGGYGVCKEFPFEGFYREARLLRLLYGREGELDRALGKRFLQEGSRQ
jgi:alkylation response protein AidB-like acyl-CoA dehydrogenase